MSGLSCSRKVPGDTGRRDRSEGAAAGAAELPENLRARQSCPYTAACGKRRALGWGTALCQTPRSSPVGVREMSAVPFGVPSPFIHAGFLFLTSTGSCARGWGAAAA